MKNIKTFEEVNYKNLLAGAMMALATSCSKGTIDGERSDVYSGDIMVKKIEVHGNKNSYFLVKGKDIDGHIVTFHTHQLTFNIGDSVHVDLSKKQAYPLKDKENISKF